MPLIGCPGRPSRTVDGGDCRRNRHSAACSGAMCATRRPSISAAAATASPDSWPSAACSSGCVLQDAPQGRQRPGLPEQRASVQLPNSPHGRRSDLAQPIASIGRRSTLQSTACKNILHRFKRKKWPVLIRPPTKFCLRGLLFLDEILINQLAFQVSVIDWSDHQTA